MPAVARKRGRECRVGLDCEKRRPSHTGQGANSQYIPRLVVVGGRMASLLSSSCTAHSLRCVGLQTPVDPATRRTLPGCDPVSDTGHRLAYLNIRKWLPSGTRLIGTCFARPPLRRFKPGVAGGPGACRTHDCVSGASSGCQTCRGASTASSGQTLVSSSRPSFSERSAGRRGGSQASSRFRRVGVSLDPADQRARAQLY